MLRRVLVSALLLSFVSLPAFAQQGTGDLRGQVTDQQGASLPGVTIVLRHQESGLFRESVSGGDGTFFFSGMTPGVYQVTAELASFKKYEARDVRIEVGRTAQLQIPLELGGVTESVTVSAEAPLVDTTTKEIGGVVSAQEFVDTPLFNRNFAGFLGMLPGVVATVSLTTFGADSISVAGQNVRNVNYTMDGSNNNDTFNGGNGGAQARVPIEAVQEFQLLTGQFDAEYGLSSGGIVNSVSKQGTNQWRGSAFSFFQDDKFTSRDYFAEKEDLPLPETKQQQFGGTLGGPIIRDKAHFFASVERVIVDGGVTMNVPSRPEFNRTDFEITRVWNTFIRGDHQLSPNNTWGLRWLRETSPQPVQLNNTNWASPARNEAETDIDWTLVGNLSSVIGATRVNTFRISAVKEDVFFGNPLFNETRDQRSLLPLLNHPSWSDQQSARASRRLDVAYGMDNVFAWFLPNKRGDHDLKFGVNYLYSTLRNEDYGNMNGTFTFNSDLDFNPNDPRTYPERLSVRVPNASNFLVKGHFIGVFAQDKWKLNNRLTLSVGARYDLELVPTPTGDNPLFAGADQEYPIDKDNVSPRIGFSYALDDQGRSVVRGGTGLFFQRTSYTFLNPFFSNGRFSDSFTASFPTNQADTGPRNGRLPTDPMLINGPVLNRAAIDAMFPPGSRIRNVGAVRFDNPDREVAWARQYSLGYERQLGNALSLSVDLIRSEQRAQYMLKELNPGVRDSTSAITNSTIRRLNPLIGTVGEFASNVTTPINVGWIDYTSVQVSAEKRMSRGARMRVSYAWSRGRGNTDSGQGDTIVSQFLDELRLDTEVGPTSIDRPHIFSMNGSYEVPRTKGLLVSGVFQARSGTPFSLINTAVDMDRNGLTANEYLAPGTYSGVGEDAITVEYAGGRRGARGPSWMNVDLRAGYRFRFQDNRSLEASMDIINVTNRANFSNPSGDIRFPASFLIVTDIVNGGPTRTLQFNLRYAF
jgi:hypothetical protein